MAAVPYRLVGPDPQLVMYVCDDEADIPSVANAGDIIHVKSNGRTAVRMSGTWGDTGTTLAQRDALSGTSGVPDSLNKFVTEKGLEEKLDQLAAISDARWAVRETHWPDGHVITPPEKATAADRLKSDRIARTRKQ